MRLPRHTAATLTVASCLAAPLAADVAVAEPPVQVADLATEPVEGPSSPFGMARLGDHLYFSAQDDVRGRELWRSDGTAAGTELVEDLCPGRCSSEPEVFTLVDDRLFFVARSATGQRGIWVTDGTDSGPTFAGHLPGDSLSRIYHPVAFGGKLYFSASHPELGFELWSSDGTPTGTQLAVDLCPGACSSAPTEITPMGDALLFAAGTGAGNRELWRSDGTRAGTRRVADVCDGPCSSEPYALRAIGGRLFFSADDGVHGRELWVSDGTAAGTYLLEDFAPGPDSSAPGAFPGPDGRIYVRTAGGPGDVRFWRTDGTPGGAQPASELLPYGLERHPQTLVPGADRLYFTIQGTGGEELWILGAGESSSRRITGPFGSISPACCGWGLGLAADGDLAFVTRQQGSDAVWVTDGTVGGTRRVLEVEPGAGGPPGFLSPLGERWLFTWDDGVHGEEPWVTDGTPTGTALLRNLNLPDASSDPRELTSWRGQVFFNTGEEPFGPHADRSAWRIADPEAGALLVDPEEWLRSATAAGDHLFYTDPRTGFPMTLADPGGAPVLLADVFEAHLFTPADDRTFFALQPNGQQVWVSDGTPGGTRLLRDVNPEWSTECNLSPCVPVPVYPHGLTAAGDRLFFVALSEEDPELWTSDGTTDGTVEVPGAPVPGELAALGERVVLLTAPEAAEAGVWRSNGTAAGTRRLASLPPGARPRRAVAADGLVYFLTTAEGGRTLLWRTDGTAAGTVPVLESDTAYPPDPNEMVALGRRLVFSGFATGTGEELWISDGTAGGTGLLADLRPGPRSSNPTALTVVGDVVVFAADDGATGHEPWATDGTAGGTIRLVDVRPGTDGSSPGGFAAADGDWIVFDADDGESGREPWALRLEQGGGGGAEEPPPVPDAPPFISGELPGFRFWVRITAGDGEIPVRQEAACIPETVCVSGAVPGRPELFLRVVGPKPNGRLWPTLVRFSTSTIEVWIEQESSGLLRYYRLEGATPGSSSLDGLFDREGFPAAG